MKLKSLIIFAILPFFGLAQINQSKEVDSSAVYLLDHMTQIIGDLNSCRFELKTTTDEVHFEYGLIKKSASHKVAMVGPDKMSVQSVGDDFHKGYWYNGENFTYYSYAEGNYSIIDAPGDILTTIDSLYTLYDIEFPAADIFYPAFTDDLLESFDTVKNLGTKEIEGNSCYHILATSSDLQLQIWISNDAYTLPKKFVIINKQKPGHPQYEATFYDWEINPDLPDSMFDFVPPPDTKEIYIVPKTELD